MSSGCAKTCAVPVARMQSLAEQLRLLKAEIALVQGRLDILLTEIGNEIQREHASPEDEAPREIQSEAQDKAQPNDADATANSSTPPDEASEFRVRNEVEAGSEKGDAITPVSTEPAARVLAVCSDQLTLNEDVDASVESDPGATQIDAIGATLSAEVPPAEAPTDALDSNQVKGGAGAALVAPITERPLPGEGRLATIKAGSVGDLPNNSGAPTRILQAPRVPCASPPNISFLSHQRKQVVRNSRFAITGGQWAAAMALIAMFVALAVLS